MEKYGRDILSDQGQIHIVKPVLDGTAVDWVVDLHDANTPELQNFNQFMAALRCHFEDPLADHKAQEQIKTIWQSRQAVVEYTQEFQALASKLN